MSYLGRPQHSLRILFLATILAGLSWLAMAGNASAAPTASPAAAPTASQIDIDDGGVIVEPGDAYAYTITFSSPVTATAATITQTIPSDIDFDVCDLHAPLSGSCTASPEGVDIELTSPLLPNEPYTVTTHFTAGPSLAGDIHSSVTMAGLDEGGQPLSEASDDIITSVHLPRAQIVLALENGVDTLQPGDVISYTVSISNTGDAQAGNVALSFTLPGGAVFVSASDGGTEAAGQVSWPAFSLPHSTETMRTVTLRLSHPLDPTISELAATATATFDGAQTPLPTAQDVDGVASAIVNGRVWHDANGNGVQEPAESGMDGVMLTATSAEQTAVLVTTAAGGAYEFVGMALQPYTVTVDVSTLPPEMIAIFESDLSLDGQQQVDLSSGVQTTAADFSYAAHAAIQDNFAWADVNADGLFNPDEPGIEGISLILTYAGFDGVLNTPDDALATTETNGDGQYGFESLLPGKYRLVLDEASIPNGYAKSIYPQGSGDGVVLFTLLSGQTAAGLNYGFNVLDLSIYKLLQPVDITTSTLLPYEIFFANTSQVDAQQVRMIEIIPLNSAFAPNASHPNWHCPDGYDGGNRCELLAGMVPSDTSTSISFTVIVTGSMPAHVNVITNTVQITDELSMVADPTPENNQYALVSEVQAEPDLIIIQTDGGSRTEPGSILRYTMDYANQGNQGASGVVIAITVPANTRFSAAESTPGWLCADGSASGAECIFPVGTLAAGSEGSIDFVMTVDYTMPVNVATIDAEVVIRDDSDHEFSDGELTPIDAAPDLILGESQPDGMVFPGSVIQYTLHYTNAGNRDAIGVLIVETIPENTRFHEADSTPGWDCPDGANAGESCIFVVGALPVDATGTVQFAVLVNDDLTPVGGSIEHEAVIAGSGVELDILNNTSSSSTQLLTPTVVDLLSFTAAGQENGSILVEWRTGAERNSWGFLLYRSTDTDWGHAVSMTPSLLQSTGDENTGATYSYVDGVAFEGVTYYYWLHELEYSGHTNIYGPVQGRIGGAAEPILSNQSYAPMIFR